MPKESNSSPKKLAKDSFNIVTTGSLSAINPGLGIAYSLAMAFFSNALELRKSKVEEWVSMIDGHQKVFEKSFVSTVDFQDAFVSALEDYIRLRSLLKRKIAQKIFLGYATSDDMDAFQLERLNQTLNNMSAQTIKFMKFLSLEIEPIRSRRIESDVATFDLKNGRVSEANIRDSVNRQQLMSFAYDEWMEGKNKFEQIMIPSSSDANRPSVASEGAIYIMNNLAKHDDSLIELESLGIIWRKQYSQTLMTWSATPEWFDRWSLTDFGLVMMEYISEDASIDN